MGTVRECFVCGMLLARLERENVWATPPGGEAKLQEVCVRCHGRVRASGALSVMKKELLWVVRPRVVSGELFPAASRKTGGGHGRAT